MKKSTEAAAQAKKSTEPAAQTPKKSTESVQETKVKAESATESDKSPPPSPQQNLAALKNLIAKAAAGTLPKSPPNYRPYRSRGEPIVQVAATKVTTEIQTSPPVSKKEFGTSASPPPLEEEPVVSAKVDSATTMDAPPEVDEEVEELESEEEEETGTKVETKEEIKEKSVQKEKSRDEIDYWEQEKVKMQMTPSRYQGFQGVQQPQQAQSKKNVVSKSTSPPPQTISTQVNDLHCSLRIELLSLFYWNTDVRTGGFKCSRTSSCRYRSSSSCCSSTRCSKCSCFDCYNQYHRCCSSSSAG